LLYDYIGLSSMRVNRTTKSLAAITFLLVFLAGFFYFVPFEMNDTEATWQESNISDHLRIVNNFQFTPRSYDERIDILLNCTEGSLDVVVINRNQWGNWYQEEEYSSYYEVKNTTLVHVTVEIQPSYGGTVFVIISTPYGAVAMSGEVVGHSMAYYEPVAFILLAVAIPFAVAFIWNTIMTKQKPKATMSG
jgi:hypothetical protein